jgi:hypothetical protein
MSISKFKEELRILASKNKSISLETLKAYTRIVEDPEVQGIKYRIDNEETEDQFKITLQVYYPKKS